MRFRIPSAPKVEQTGNVRIITFTLGTDRTAGNVIAVELAGLTEDLGQGHLLLDFTNVEYITSEELGALIGLHKIVGERGGRLTLFNLSAQVFEVFTVVQLQRLLSICR